MTTGRPLSPFGPPATPLGWRHTSWIPDSPLRFAFFKSLSGSTATLAGLDKFFNILANWGSYVSPLAARLLPFSVGTFMGIVGVVEMAVGVSILAVAPRKGAYAASAWLLLVAVNLAVAGYFDIAVRDVVMSIAAFTLARALEVRESAAATSPVDGQPACRGRSRRAWR